MRSALRCVLTLTGVLLAQTPACTSSAPPPTNLPTDVHTHPSDGDAAPGDASAGDVREEATLPDATQGPPDALVSMDGGGADGLAPDAVPPDAPPVDGTLSQDAAMAEEARVPDAVAADAPAETGACGTPMTLCPLDGGATVCTNLQTDLFHCGRCGGPCCGGLRCLAGVCTSVRCPPLQTPCPAARPTAEGCYDAPCRDLLSDDANCGACGNACPKGVACLRGRCEG